MDDVQPPQTNTEGESTHNLQAAPESVVTMSPNGALQPVLPTGGSATSIFSSAAPAAVLQSEEYLPTFSGDPDEDSEDFISEVREFFTTPANAALPERVKTKIAHRQLRGQAARANKFFATTGLYQQFQRGSLGWEEPVEVFFTSGCSRKHRKSDW
jgi:hypothetical protein